MKITSRRNVSHSIKIELDDEDKFDAEATSYNQRGKPFQVEHVSWPGAYRNSDLPLTDDTLVNIGGSLYKQDGTVGKRGAHRTSKVSELPPVIREALITEHANIYKP